MIQEPGNARPVFIINARIDSRDFARITLYWNRQGVTFQSRSEMIRATLELFIRLNKIEEVDSFRAGEILQDEFYRKSARQEAVHAVVTRAHDVQMRQIAERLAQQEKPLNLNELINELPEEKVV